MEDALQLGRCIVAHAGRDAETRVRLDRGEPRLGGVGRTGVAGARRWSGRRTPRRAPNPSAWQRAGFRSRRERHRTLRRSGTEAASRRRAASPRRRSACCPSGPIPRPRAGRAADATATGSRCCSASGRLTRSSSSSRWSAGTPRNATMPRPPSGRHWSARLGHLGASVPGAAEPALASAVATGLRGRRAARLPLSMPCWTWSINDPTAAGECGEQERGHVAVLAHGPDRVHVLGQRDQGHRLLRVEPVRRRSPRATS